MKRLPHLLFCLIFPLCLAADEEVPGRAAPEIEAAAAVVIDARTGHELFAKNGSEQRPVASTQKLLTALLVVEAGHLNEPVTVEASDTDVIPIIVGLKAGETYVKRHLLEALLIKSGNDLAMTLGRSTAGSVEAFSILMNRRARQLHAWSSHFVNPSGLPAEGQYSTARDMARIARAVYFHPLLRDIIDTRRSIFKRQDGVDLAMVNTNKLLGRTEWVNGMKTGYTNAAGLCLISSGLRDGREIICVVLGSSSAEIWNDSEKLLNWSLSLP